MPTTGGGLNPAAERLLGRTRSATLGRNATQVLAAFAGVYSRNEQAGIEMEIAIGEG
jgi:hypothetical protein